MKKLFLVALLLASAFSLGYYSSSSPEIFDLQGLWFEQKTFGSDQATFDVTSIQTPIAGAAPDQQFRIRVHGVRTGTNPTIMPTIRLKLTVPSGCSPSTSQQVITIPEMQPAYLKMGFEVFYSCAYPGVKQFKVIAEKTDGTKLDEISNVITISTEPTCKRYSGGNEFQFSVVSSKTNVGKWVPKTPQGYYIELKSASVGVDGKWLGDFRVLGWDRETVLATQKLYACQEFVDPELGVQFMPLEIFPDGHAVLSIAKSGVAACVDSDGDKPWNDQIVTKGTCKDMTLHVDSTFSTTKITEYYCKDRQFCKGEVIDCTTYGYDYAQDGKCVKKTVPTPTVTPKPTITPSATPSAKTLRVFVVDDDGAVKTASVDLSLSTGRPVDSKKTDSEGVVNFYPLDAGEYLLKVSKGGYYEYSSQVSVSATDAITEVKVVLQKTSDVAPEKHWIRAFVEKGKLEIKNGNGVLSIHGTGTITVTGAKPVVAGYGTAITNPDGSYTYKGDGMLVVKGSKVDIKASGENFNFYAQGTGQLKLEGRGTYSAGAVGTMPSKWTGIPITNFGITLNGKGWLKAYGSGSISAEGASGGFVITGNGEITITDNAGGSKRVVTGFGSVDVINANTKKYKGYGTVFLKSSNFAFSASGTVIDFYGKGSATSLTMNGDGRFKIGSDVLPSPSPSPSPQPTTKCVDTDSPYYNTIDPFTKGTCTDKTGSYSDKTLDSKNIEEWYCNPPMGPNFETKACAKSKIDCKTYGLEYYPKDGVCKQQKCGNGIQELEEECDGGVLPCGQGAIACSASCKCVKQETGKNYHATCGGFSKLKCAGSSDVQNAGPTIPSQITLAISNELTESISGITASIGGKTATCIVNVGTSTKPVSTVAPKGIFTCYASGLHVTDGVSFPVTVKYYPASSSTAAAIVRAPETDSGYVKYTLETTPTSSCLPLQNEFAYKLNLKPGDPSVIESVNDVEIKLESISNGKALFKISYPPGNAAAVIRSEVGAGDNLVTFDKTWDQGLTDSYGVKIRVCSISGSAVVARFGTLKCPRLENEFTRRSMRESESIESPDKKVKFTFTGVGTQTQQQYYGSNVYGKDFAGFDVESLQDKKHMNSYALYEGQTSGNPQNAGGMTVHLCALGSDSRGTYAIARFAFTASPKPTVSAAVITGVATSAGTAVSAGCGGFSKLTCLDYSTTQATAITVSQAHVVWKNTAGQSVNVLEATIGGKNAYCSPKENVASNAQFGCLAIGVSFTKGNIIPVAVTYQMAGKQYAEQGYITGK